MTDEEKETQMEGMEPTQVRPKLYRVFLPQDMPGFQKFIGSWAYDGECKFLVDVGPRSSFEKLMEGLQALRLQRLDFIFLTHIHIDHAGATGLLVKHFPEAKVVCHESGARHLIDPRKLWEGSKKILGEVAIQYGEIEPVPERNLVSPELFCRNGFKVINTPGHAPHHISLLFGDTLFVGEAGGIFLDLKDNIYLRPATPVRFILEETVGSIDRLLGTGAREICYAHMWIHHDAKSMLRRYRDQLHLWRDVIAEQMRIGEDDLIERCMAALIEKDESLRLYPRFSEDDKERESFFIRNGIEGFIDYLKRP